MTTKKKKKLFKKNIKKKKMILLLIIIIISIIVLLSIIFSISIFNTLSREKFSYNFKKEYEKLNNKETDFGQKYLEINIPSRNKMKYSSVEDILEIFNEKTDAVIYFGNSNCAYCRPAAEVLINTANDTKIRKIYYLDTNDKTKNYDSLLNLFTNEYIEDNKIYSPLVLFVAKGNIVSYHKGTLFSQDDPHTGLDNSQKEGLSEIYKSGINDVLKSTQNN